MHKNHDWTGVNFILQDGKKSDLPYNEAKENEFSEVCIQPKESEVRRITVWTNSDNYFRGVQFFDAKNNEILKAAKCGG
jgi:CTP:phosphocholine cytidylyltransferase-like protein